MKIFGYEISRTKAAGTAASASVVDSRSGWWPIIRESFTGAWQRNIDCDNQATQLAFSAVYACVTIIASDIGKLPIRLMSKNVKSGAAYWRPFGGARETELLNRPNHYQTRSQFIEAVVLSRLIHGNAYILKGRDSRGFVNSLYVLSPPSVSVKVAPDSSVYYELRTDNMAGLEEAVTVPESEIIHNRAVTLHHPLIGVSPIFACGWPATLGNRIQRHSATFFANGGRPSGVLTAPAAISQETATRMKEYWDSSFLGSNAGKVAILGDGLKYEAMAMSSIDAQLIEQLRWSVEDVARCYRVPLYMLGAGQMPTFNNIESLQRMYFSQTLHAIMESLEQDFDKAFDLPFDQKRMEFDVSELLRMDSATRFASYQTGIAGGWLSPNEVRAMEDLPAVEGGDSPMMQSQNWSLAALSQRDGVTDQTARKAATEAKQLFSRHFYNALVGAADEDR